MSLEKNVFNNKWSPKLIFLNELFFWKISVDFWLRKLTLKVRFWHFLTNHNSSTDFFLKIFPLSVLILGQKSCFLGPTIFKIPQPNWYYSGEHLVISQFWTEITSDFFWSHCALQKVKWSRVVVLVSELNALWSKSMPRGGSNPGNALLRQNM